VVASLVIIWLTGWSLSIFGSTMQSTLGTGRLSLSMWEVIYYLNDIGVIPNTALGFLAWAGYIWIAAVAIATILAYKWFGFDTERGIVQSLILITLTFLLLRGQVNEQYALYLFALALIDVALWSPKRKTLFWALVAAVLMFHVTNDVVLLRYLSPVYPRAEPIEASIIAAINPERNALLFVAAMAFWALNISYFYGLFKERRSRSGGPISSSSSATLTVARSKTDVEGFTHRGLDPVDLPGHIVDARARCVIILELALNR
jgi:hypothetical protein